MERSRTGAIIPTLLIVPPSVDLSRCEAGCFRRRACCCTRTANAMDLSDSIYVLRAFAESFDCACLGYEYVGYGMCGQCERGRVQCGHRSGVRMLDRLPSRRAIPDHTVRPITRHGTIDPSRPPATVELRRASSPVRYAVRAACRTPMSTLDAVCDMFASCDLLSELTLPVLLLHGERTLSCASLTLSACTTPLEGQSLPAAVGG